MLDNVLHIQGSVQALVILHDPNSSTASLSKGWGFGGAYKPTCSAASNLVSLGSAWTERGMGTLYISILGL